ncbi:MAG: RICIN domain-containing protein [Clostridia bacterium]|nr:RICIN domain-containing protein [Clostridia bacterium]
MKYTRRLISIALLLSVLLTTLGNLSAFANVTESEAIKSETLDNDFEEFEQQNKFLTEKNIKSDTQLVASLSTESKFFNYVDKTQFEQANHVLRLKQEETLNTFVFLNRDGSKSVYFMDENVKYIANDGSVREKNISLNSDNGSYTITENDFSLKLPSKIDDGIDLVSSKTSVTLIPINANEKSIAQQEDNSVIYKNAFEGIADLRYTPMLSGVKEDIILSSYKGVNTFSFILHTDEMYLFEDKQGYYFAQFEYSSEKIYLGEIIIFDAVGKPDFGTIEVEAIKEGKEYILTVVANEDFLTDPNTKYPVTIDPQLTFSDTLTGTGSIEDVVIFSGAPNYCGGTYLYLTTGYVDSSYKIARVAMRLPGLYNNTAYNSISAENIMSANLYLRDASGHSNQQINLYRFTSNNTWTESNLTWNTAGTYSTANNWGGTMKPSAFTSYNITSLVKGWRNGTYDPQMGFILVNSDETNASNNKQPYSSEYSNADYRPYVVFTYIEDITLNKSSATLYEGGSTTLSINENVSGLLVNWTSSDPTVATVNSSGVVTALKAGTTTITVAVNDYPMHFSYAYCQIYVRIEDGVYYIKNQASNYYLTVLNGGITNKTDVIQSTRSTVEPSSLKHLWKICYLGDGYYTIRPLHKPTMGLDVTNGNVDIFNTGHFDSFTYVPTYSRWIIEFEATNYVFKNYDSSTHAIEPQNASPLNGTTIVTATYSSNKVAQRWSLENVTSPPSGVILYDLETETIINNPTRAVVIGETKNLTQLRLSCVVYSGASISQEVMWSSSNNSVATVSSSGAVTGISEGTATITATRAISGHYETASFTVYIVEELFNDGTYYIKNREFGRYVQIDSSDAPNYSTNGATIAQADYSGEDWQQWIFTSLENGYHKIINKKSGLALTVPTENIAEDASDLIQSSYIGNNNQQWKITSTEYNTYVITPRSGEADNFVVGVSSSFSKVKQRDVSSGSCQNEWIITTKNEHHISIKPYYDNGFIVRNNLTTSEVYDIIDECLSDVAAVLKSEYNLKVFIMEPEYFNSAIDQCKGVVTSSNIDTLCTHSGTKHTDYTSIISDFGGSVSNREKHVNVYFTGHRIKYESQSGKIQYNRSFSNANNLYILKLNEADSNFESYIDEIIKPCILHELSHQIGGRDHYHEVNTFDHCIHSDICSVCAGPLECRSMECIMYDTIRNMDNDTIYCYECSSEIRNYLDEGGY